MKRRKRQKEPLKVELIPIYISPEAFAEKKEEVQNLISRMLIDYHKKKVAEKSTGSTPTTI